MNRLILLDYLRHGWVRLLVIGCLIVGGVVPLTAFALSEENFSLAVILSLASFFLCFSIRPGLGPVADALHLEALLPVPRIEIINSHWLLRVILPSVWLTASFTLAWLLGLTDQLNARLPPYLPLHLFAAFLGGLSIIFFSVNASAIGVQAASGTSRPRNFWFVFSLAVCLHLFAWGFSTGYLVLVSNLREMQTAALILVAFSGFLAAAVHRAVRPGLLTPVMRRSAPAVLVIETETKRESEARGLWQLISISVPTSTFVTLGFIVSLPALELLLSANTWQETALESANRWTTYQMPMMCVLMRFVSEDTFVVHKDLRLFRILPVSSGGLAVRFLASKGGIYALVFIVLLGPLSVIAFGIETGCFVLTLSLCCVAVTSFVTPIALRFSSLNMRVLFALPFVFILIALCNNAYDGYVDGSLAPLMIACVLGLASVLGAWWLTVRLLAHSPEVYRQKTPAAVGM